MPDSCFIVSFFDSHLLPPLVWFVDKSWHSTPPVFDHFALSKIDSEKQRLEMVVYRSPWHFMASHTKWDDDSRPCGGAAEALRGRSGRWRLLGLRTWVHRGSRDLHPDI